MKKHYTFDSEEAEFEAGNALTRYDIYYQLDMFKDIISELDYKNPIDQVFLKEISQRISSLYYYFTKK